MSFENQQTDANEAKLTDSASHPGAPGLPYNAVPAALAAHHQQGLHGAPLGAFKTPGGVMEV